MFFEQSLIMLAGILDTTIRVSNQFLSQTVTGNCHLQDIHHQTTVDPLRHRPAHVLPGEQVFHSRQVQPAFVMRRLVDI